MYRSQGDENRGIYRYGFSGATNDKYLYTSKPNHCYRANKPRDKNNKASARKSL